MKPSLRQLEAFVYAAHLGSFARGAEKMALSQPAFSQVIAQLEMAFDKRLFERTTRSLRLTPEGAFLLPRAERILADVTDTVRDFQEVVRGRHERLSIGGLPLLASNVLAPLIEQYRSRNPQVRISVQDADAESLNRAVEVDQLDMALCIKPEGRPELAFQPIFRDPFQAVLRRDDALAATSRLSWDALLKRDFLYFRPESGGQATLHRALAAAGVKLSPVMELYQTGTLLAMVDTGLGFTVLPKASCLVDAYPRLCTRRIEDPVIEREVGIVTSVRRSLPHTAATFRLMLLDAFSHIPKE